MKHLALEAANQMLLQYRPFPGRLMRRDFSPIHYDTDPDGENATAINDPVLTDAGCSLPGRWASTRR